MYFRFNVRCSRTANIKSAAKVLLFCYKQMNLYFFFTNPLCSQFANCEHLDYYAKMSLYPSVRVRTAWAYEQTGMVLLYAIPILSL